MYDTPLNEQITVGESYSNGEYIELYNVGVDTINLTGWVLRGGGSTEIYDFPSSTTIPPKAFLIVAYQYYNSDFTVGQLYTNLSTNADKQILYQRKIVLSNSGEQIYLRDSYGITKDSIYYDGTSNKTKPNRLSADNADGTPGDSCVCIQRKTATFTSDGSAVPNNAEWVTTVANPFVSYSSFIPPILPGVGESYTYDSPATNAVITSSGNSFSSSNTSATGISDSYALQTNGADGKQTASYIFPVIWFKTIPISTDMQNGYYAWCDFSGNNMKLRKYDSRGAAYGDEYIVPKNNTKSYNFNPAINISLEQISKEILNTKSALSQTTIMGVWGPNEENIPETDNFVFALNGRQSESAVFTKSQVIESDESGKDNITYGNGDVKNLLYQSDLASENTEDKYNEQSLRIATYYRAGKPDYSLWGERKSVISLGGDFDSNNVNNVSSFSNELSTTQAYKGYAPELLVFDKTLTPKENIIFQTYLSLKYGISLDTTYVSPDGTTMWDYNDAENTPFNHRITGYSRQDALGLYQTTSTTAYEEAPYFSYINGNDSYDNNDFYNMSSRNKLLVIGNEPANPFNNGDYVIWGDNGNSITVPSENTIPNFKATERQWLLRTNILPTDSACESLIWTSSPKLQITENTNHTLSVYKPSTVSYVSSVTGISLKGKDGYLGWTITNLSGTTIVKFGTQNATPTENSNDYGYAIKSGGKLSKIERGRVSDTFFETVSIGQKIEVEKTGNMIYLRINGKKIKDSECLITDSADLSANYYGAISIENSYKVVISDFRHGGFVNTGNKVELSYYTNRASGFAADKENVYLIIDRSGSGEFNSENVDSYKVSEIDASRYKLIFHNVFWDTDGNGKDVFTFGYRNITSSMVRKQNPTQTEEPDKDNYTLVYYKDNQDLSLITVKVYLYEGEPYTLQLYDISGRTIYRKDFSGSKQEQFTDIRLPSSGFYVVKVVSKSYSYSTKVMSNK